MQTYVLRCEMKVPATLEETFAVFENPYNLARITPPWLHFQVLDRDLKMAQGLRINYTIRWMGLPMRWRTLITSYRPPHRFTDLQERGPYRLWHHVHTFKPAPDGGTIVGDEVTYALPLGVLGRMAHWIMVERQLLGIFRFRQRALAAMFGGTVTEVVLPAVTRGSAITEQQLAEYRA